MSHLILENDLTFSVSSPEWHGKAIVAESEAMPELVRENLCFPIVEGQAVAMIDGDSVPLRDEKTGKGWKIILADCRNLPEHEGREEQPANLVPLHVPKQGYFPLENGRFFEMASDAFDSLGLPFNVSTAGTLGNLKRFYFSVSVEGMELKTPDGNSISSFLNFLSSHDGFLVPTVKDSHIRTVCHNTFSAVMRELANFELKGRHTENGLRNLENLAQAIDAMRENGKELSETFERLANQESDLPGMREITAGYFFQDTLKSGNRIPDNVTLTKQAENAIEEITTLARIGAGNDGRNLFDLWNGATDYWSNGGGVGSAKVGLAKKASRSNFGQAAEHKTAFSRYLFDGEAVEAGRKVGAMAIANTEKAN